MYDYLTERLTIAFLACFDLQFIYFFSHFSAIPAQSIDQNICHIFQQSPLDCADDGTTRTKD